MSGTKLGELVCVLIKGKNLPNRQRIGKQDPYVICRIYQDIKKTKADKNGGQHPEWDEELRFDIFDKAEYRKMKLSVLADDARDPSLIGESTVDLEAALSKGEFDDWIELKHKEKFAGEVYIELTFYSASAPPLPPPPPPEKMSKTSPSQNPRTQALPISMRPGFDASKNHIDFSPPAAVSTPRPTLHYAPAIVPRRSQRMPPSHATPNQYPPRPLPALNASPNPSLLNAGHISPQGRPLPQPPYPPASNKPSPSISSNGSVIMAGQPVNYINGAYNASTGIQRPPMHQSPSPSLDPPPGRIRTHSWNGGQNPMYAQPAPLGSRPPQTISPYPPSNHSVLPPRTSISATPPQQHAGGYFSNPPPSVPTPRPVQSQQYGNMQQTHIAPFTMPMPEPFHQPAPPLPPHPQQHAQSQPPIYPPNNNTMGRLSPQPAQYPPTGSIMNGSPPAHSFPAGYHPSTPTPPPYPPKPNEAPMLPPRAQSASPYQGSTGYSIYPPGPPGGVYPPPQPVHPPPPQQFYPPQNLAQGNMSHPQQPGYPPNSQSANWR